MESKLEGAGTMEPKVKGAGSMGWKSDSLGKDMDGRNLRSSNICLVMILQTIFFLSADCSSCSCGCGSGGGGGSASRSKASIEPPPSKS